MVPDAEPFSYGIAARQDGDLSTWIQWLMTAHVRRYHRHYHSSGHIWQGRYKSFVIQDDHHHLAVLRYVESNALRANLAERAECWKWSSLYALKRQAMFPFLDPGPVRRPRNWLALVNKEQPEKKLNRFAPVLFENVLLEIRDG